jgi:hypothetical protein
VATSSYPAGQTYGADTADVAAARGVGWVTFAAVILGFAGTLNFIDGLVAVSKSKFYVNSAVFVFSDLNTWGWIVMVLGIVELGAAAALFAGSQVARWFGVFAATVNGIGQLLFVQAYPFWSLSIFTLDVLVIYALTVYGRKNYAADFG